MILGLGNNQLVLGLVLLVVLYLVWNCLNKKETVVKKVKMPETVVELGPNNLAVLKYGGSDGVCLTMVENGRKITSEMGLDEIKGVVSMAMAFDLNRDGYSDLILGGPQIGLWVYENRIHGQFRSGGFVGVPVLPGNGIGIRTVLVHDFDRNGNADLMVYYVDGSVKVLKNVGGAGVGSSHLSYVEVDKDSLKSMAEEMQSILEDLPLGWSSFDDNDERQYKFAVKLPNNIEFANSKVMVRVGAQHVVKYNVAGMGQNGLVVFDFDQNVPIDGVKVRTIYGKAHSYARQPMGSVLVVDPIVKFDSQHNLHRSQSMG